MLKQLWESVKQITVYQVIVACISGATFVAPAYYFMKPIAVSAAGSAINNLLVAQGVDPKQFKEIPDKVKKQGEAQTRIESDLATIKAQQQQLLDLLKEQITTPPR